MPDDYSLYDKMRFGLHAVMNQLRCQPTNEQINTAIASVQAASRREATAARGMCLIIFPGTDHADVCRNGMTEDDCQNLAKSLGGFCRAVRPGSVCPQ